MGFANGFFNTISLLSLGLDALMFSVGLRWIFADAKSVDSWIMNSIPTV